MDKYQEALKHIEDIYYGTHQGYINEIDVDAIKELVDRATPKSPAGFVLRNPICPYCWIDYKWPQITKPNFCPDCGQAIYWHEEKEEIDNHKFSEIENL